MNEPKTAAGQWRMLLRAEGDRLLAWILIAVGAVLVVATFIGVSGTPFVADQLAYIASGGIGGLFLLACGLTLMVSADHHDEWRKLDRIEQALLGQDEAETIWLDPPGAPLRRPRPVAGEERPAARAGLPARSLVMAVAVLAAGVIIAVGWAQASGTASQGVAARGLTVSLAGLFVMLVGAAAILGPSRQRLSARRAHLLRGFLLADAPAGFAASPARRSMPTATPETVFVSSGLSRYHLAGCPALAGLSAQPVARVQIDSKLQGCELCGAAGS